MKKKIKRLSIIFMVGINTVLIYNIKAKALDLHLYNGSSVGSQLTPSGDCGSLTVCRYKLRSSQYRGIRVSFVYYDKDQPTYKYQYVGAATSYDIWAGDLAYESANIYHVSESVNTKPNGINPLLLSDLVKGYTYHKDVDLPSDTENWSPVIKNYFMNGGDPAVVEKYAKILTGCSLQDTSPTCFGKEHYEADPTEQNLAPKGYRILIEPIHGYQIKTGSNSYMYAVLTPTELARLKLGGTPVQDSYFSGNKSEDILVTDFKDIGFEKVTAAFSCRNGGCDENSYAGQNGTKLGHALQIIDFTDYIPNTSCDVTKPYNNTDPSKTNLTQEEQDCCNDAVAAIKTKYDNLNPPQFNPDNCMTASGNITEYLTCITARFTVISEYNKKKDDMIKDLTKLKQDYPLCAKCDYVTVEKIEQDYKDCLNGQNLLEWLIKFIQGCDGQCEITRKLAIQQLKADPLNSDCPTELLNEDCPFATCVINTNIPNKDCSVTPSIPDPITGCDENDPSHFPPTADMTCCLYYQDQWQTKLNASDNPDVVKAEIQQWFEYQDPTTQEQFRKNCLTPSNSCTLTDLQNGTITDPQKKKDCCDLMKADPNNSGITDAEWASYGCPVTVCDLSTVGTLTEPDKTNCCNELKTTYPYITD